MSSMLVAKEATAQSQEGTFLDVAKIDLVGKVESNKTVVV